MIHIKTYQDLLACGDDDKKRMRFILDAVNDHQSSVAYKKAQANEQYYDGENPHILHLEKLVYDFQGIAHRDLYSANHKIPSDFFGFALDQEVSYLLRNGIMFDDKATTEALGEDISRRTADVLTNAGIAGVGFGFWNLDHLEAFQLADTDTQPGFVPLYDEMTGHLRAGIRYWQIDTDKPQNYTLYEAEGITEYIKKKGEDIQLSVPRHGYKTNQEIRQIDGEVISESDGGNYGFLPIWPLWYKKNHKSAIQGHRNLIDAFDLITSGMVNNVDEGNLIYWVLTNCGGMDDMDDRQFLEQLRITHVVHADGEEGAKAEAHSIEAPYQSTKEAIADLKSRLFQDFRAFDSTAIAGDATATEIKARYIPLDGKADKTEDQVSDFLAQIIKALGLTGKPSYTRNQLINKKEETETILSGAEYYDDEYITKKLLTINGDADQYDEIQNRKDAEASDRYKSLEAEMELMKQQQNQGKEGNEE